MTQLEAAKTGKITPEMKQVAENEGLEAEFIRQGIAQGNIVIPANINHTNLTPYGYRQRAYLPKSMPISVLLRISEI